MILIEVHNGNTTSNFELIAKTTKWAESNIEGRYTVVLNPDLEQEMRITYHESGESNNAPHGTKQLLKENNADRINQDS